MAPKNTSSGEGKFIVFEGPNGCGTTTHWDLAADYLRKEGLEVVQTREPGGTKLGENLRPFILGTKEYEYEPEPRIEYFLLCASRAHNVSKVILPGLNSGKIVLCDRYFTSSTIFQGYAGNREIVEQIKKFNPFATYGVKPDLRFILNIDHQEAKKRLDEIDAKEEDKFEDRNLDFQKKVSEGYKKRTRELPNTIGLDSTRPKEVNAKEIREELQKLIPSLGS